MFLTFFALHVIHLLLSGLPLTLLHLILLHLLHLHLLIVLHLLLLLVHFQIFFLQIRMINF